MEGSTIPEDFRNFYIEAGIKREFYVQQNGVSVRKNKSIVEATKAMIHDQSLQNEESNHDPDFNKLCGDNSLPDWNQNYFMLFPML